uniref:Uncharacterized protein n=1 Tax=Anguilla anguilla TaxID=7936 RepID=A0A0E9WXP7_ANGAN
MWTKSTIFDHQTWLLLALQILRSRQNIVRKGREHCCLRPNYCRENKSRYSDGEQGSGYLLPYYNVKYFSYSCIYFNL